MFNLMNLLKKKSKDCCSIIIEPANEQEKNEDCCDYESTEQPCC